MALLYIFSVTYPVGIKTFPQSVRESQWNQDRVKYLATLNSAHTGGSVADFLRSATGLGALMSPDDVNAIDPINKYNPGAEEYEGTPLMITELKHQIIFADEAALQDYVNKTAIPPGLQAELSAWKAANNISFQHAVYQLPEFQTSIDLTWVE